MKLSENEFDSALARLGDALQLGKKFTQVHLAEALGVRQSSISDAKRRRALPAAWLLRALRAYGVDSDWILSGQGAKYRVLSDDPIGALTVSEIERRVMEANQRELSVGELLGELRRKLPGVEIVMTCPAENGEGCHDR